MVTKTISAFSNLIEKPDVLAVPIAVTIKSQSVLTRKIRIECFLKAITLARPLAQLARRVVGLVSLPAKVMNFFG